MPAPTDLKGLYEYFYNTLLVSTNSIPLQPLWIAFFNDENFGQLATTVKDWENNGFSIDKGSIFNTGSLKGAIGALYAQSVKIPGDGINVSRVGPEHSGVIKGAISNGRKDLETLQIAFLETNNSFTDLILRPWSIMVGHMGLKADDLKTNITVVQYAKTGPGQSLQPRKIFTFYKIAPISIDQEEYNYGENRIIERQIEFVYNYYTVEGIPYGGTYDDVTMAQMLENTVAKSLGEQIIDQAVSFGTNLITTTGKSILTNIESKVQGTINGFIQNVEGSITGAANNLASSINNAVNGTIDKITGFNANRDTTKYPHIGGNTSPVATNAGAGNRNVTIALGDTPYGGLKIADGSRMVKTPTGDTPTVSIVPLRPETISIKTIPVNDTPIFNPARSGGSTLITELANRNKNSAGASNILINASDTPLFVHPAHDKGNTVGANMDTPVFAALPGGSLHYQNDTPNGLTIPRQTVNVNMSDVPSKIDVGIKLKHIPADDYTEGQKVSIQNVVVKRDDTVKGVSFREVRINKNDTPDSNSIPIQIVTIRKG